MAGEAMDPPIKRARLFMPLAVAVWSGRTCSTAMIPRAANARPMPSPRIVVPI